MTITGKITFADDIEFTTMDVDSDKFLIYRRQNGDLVKYSLPLSLIKEFICVEKQTKSCPFCDSQNVIQEPDTKIKNEEIMYFDGINDPLDWECLACGSNKVSLEMEVDEVIPNHNPRYGINQEIHDGNLKSGNFSNLYINGKRYRDGLHWFRIPNGLTKLIKPFFTKVMPIFKYYEKDYYIYLEYIWYLDGIQHKPAISKHLIDDCRVCDMRYLRPPKDFNRTILKYKYPNMWNLVNAIYKWDVENNYVKLQIKWDKKKYYKEIK